MSRHNTELTTIGNLISKFNCNIKRHPDVFHPGGPDALMPKQGHRHIADLFHIHSCHFN